MISYTMLSFLTLMQVWDLYTTTDALKRGYGKETNPLLKRLLKAADEDTTFWRLFYVKLVVLVALWFTQPGAAWLAGIVVLYAYVLVNNTKLWWKNRR